MFPRNTKKGPTSAMISLFLICIAFAVFSATLAWINGLPTSTMYTEELQPTSLQWGPNCIYADVTLYNNGTQSVKLDSVTVNSQPATVVYIFGSSQIDSGESAVLRVANTFVSGTEYQLAFQTAKGNKFFCIVTAEIVSSIFIAK